MGKLSNLIMGNQTTAYLPFHSVFADEKNIFGNINAGAVGATVYTVPANYVYVVTDMSISIYVSNSSVNGSGGILINLAREGSIYPIRIGKSTNATTFYDYDHAVLNLSFPFYLKAGDTIYIDKVVNDVRIDYWLHGFLLEDDM